MSDEIKTVQIVGVKGAAKIASDKVVEPARPAGGLHELLEYLFRRHSALERPQWKGPQSAHVSTRVGKP